MKPSYSRLFALLLGWGIVATLAGAVRLFALLPPGGVPLLVTALIVALAWPLGRPTWLRATADSFGVRTIVGTHVIRFLGFYFLWLHAQGRLPAEFAERAGWGDVTAAAGAVLLLLVPEGPWFYRLAKVWNAVGLADLVLAVGTGAWANIAHPGSMAEIAGLPLTLVPLWFVPVLFASHVYLFRRLVAPKRAVRVAAV